KWDHKLRQKILASSQGDRAFIDRKIELENYNAILTTSSPSYALTADRLLAQLDANISEDLKGSLTTEPVLATTFDAWCVEIQERDDRLHEEKERIQSMIDANNVARAFRHSDKKGTLLSRISDSPTTPRYAPATTNNKPADRKYLPKLTDQDKQLLNEHEGCTRCRTFYTGHRSDTCPMKASGTFPDATNYRTLTASMAEAARPRVAAAFIEAAPCDDDTDSDY
ncbi:hypothetical protein M422DRAFT_37603, partial [Sphaerobolus stellatus SS14]